LDPTAKIKNLSKGQKARAGLLIALAHRPELLVLDEPSSGLDPIVRRDILGAVIRTIADEGRTVLFSSHLLEEVEQVADLVAMIKLVILERGQRIDLDAESFAFFVIVPLSATFIYFLAVFIFGLSGDLSARQSIYPSRMFTLPVTSAALAGLPMLYGATAMAI